jgi:uncharacterized protein
MKKTIIIILTILITQSLNAQDITGNWNGMLKVQGMELRLVFNISKEAENYSATMDSPDQGAFGIPMTSAEFNNPDIKLTHAAAMIVYTGKLEDGKIIGTFTQAGQSFPMDLNRETIEKAEIVKPQDPSKPYPYISEDVFIKNTKDSVTLAGTITIPGKAGKYPAIILVSGSGPQNRNEDVFGHKPFLILSDFLTRNGIAVLRYDDRGTAASTGNYAIATTVDFASDALSAVNYLKSRTEIDSQKIGVIGHSEGGIIAPMIAAASNDISFIVLMAGTGVRGNELLLMQQEAIGRVSGLTEDELKLMHDANSKQFDIIVNTPETDSIRPQLVAYLKQYFIDYPEAQRPEGLTDDQYIEMSIAQLSTPWMINFMRYDPTIDLAKVKCPVLAINGSKDLQVPPKVNLESIEKAVKSGGNNDVTVKELPGLNHLFQECETGSPMEYTQIQQTISPTAMDEMLKWIKSKIL